jgi:hypothetical protein
MLSTARLLRRPLIRTAALRCLSSSGKDSPILLYERGGGRVTFPRACLGLSIFNSVYWCWYTLDFIPAVNQSAINELHLEPYVGYLGIAFSLALQMTTLHYPQYLVSKLEYEENAQNLMVYTHDVITLFPSTTAYTYPLGAITMDPMSVEAQRLVQAHEYFRGPMALTWTGSKIPYFMDVQQDELVDAEQLISIVLTPERVVRMANHRKKEDQSRTNRRKLKGR